ncbi:preprotein translocase subunit SecA [Aporhodopirellula aestuarii]|uniref:Protein translocase subunit SecA n=1 Tax=Aporhodopirellula aestuarii TaxID=2950107 RepID=A0ABT0U7P5_9BACT|nr:DEAD/DEAH box helicase [Aporhodopirellula aestuarii]MCM2372827.1 preprotein translocase subunit SecA [Aporhodopirellula aestuarii]
MTHPTPGTLNRTSSARSIARQTTDTRWIASVIQRGRDAAIAIQDDAGDSLQTHTQRLKTWIRQPHDQLKRSDESTEILTLAIGVVQTAVQREMSISLFDVQWHAGIVMSLGSIAEMQTGEGKTLAGVLPAYLHALRGQGVHVVTPNAYLARRDYEQLRPVYERCGISTSVVEDGYDDDQARRAYASDITYGSAHTIGFDFLRDQLIEQQTASLAVGERFLRDLRGAQSPRGRQRGLISAIVDEADDVLLDDAVSPLILSGASNGDAVDAELHRIAVEFINDLSEGEHFVFAGGDRIELTDAGFTTVYQHIEAATHSKLVRPWHEYIVSALRAAFCYQRDVHYVVRDSEIQLIDSSTGRVFADRTWSGGLHQAVQAREDLKITSESSTLGRVTKQRFFRSYRFLTGMTGTADQCQDELERVYGTPVSTIELRHPSKRETYPPRVVMTRDEKYDAVVNEAIQLAASGRPVLIGTLSVSESLEIAARLRERDCEFKILNGIQDADEAAVISAAGESGAITVATNLAGRGTDIGLDPESLTRGGLHVIVTQMHSLARVDRQLIGRAARCGDPGSCRFFIAADDDLLIQHAPWISRHLSRCDRLAEDCGLDITRRFKLLKQIETVQRRTQRQATIRRLRLLQSDSHEQQLLTLSEKRPDACWAM